MAVEIGGITIRDAVQAGALMTQGFISAEELEKVLPSLDSGNFGLMEASDMRIKNLRRPIVEIIKEKLGLYKKN